MSLLCCPESVVQRLVRVGEREERTILLVEDDEALSELILEALHREEKYAGIGYRVLLAGDGLEALEIIQETLPDLFLLDYYLPYINGLDLYDRLHAMEQFHYIPTIFISANPPLKDLKMRNVLSMRKPFLLRELLYTIRWLLVGKNGQSGAW
jgi:CheY-like chemotaxis protein